MRPVYWSEDAARDLVNILSYLADEDPDFAERVVDAIEVTGNGLGAYPTGRPGRVRRTYEKSLARYPYIIAYILQPIGGTESVVIVRVIHMARDWTAEAWPDE